MVSIVIRPLEKNLCLTEKINFFRIFRLVSAWFTQGPKQKKTSLHKCLQNRPHPTFTQCRFPKNAWNFIKILKKLTSNVNKTKNKILYPYHRWNLDNGCEDQKNTHFSINPYHVRAAAECKKCLLSGRAPDLPLRALFCMFFAILRRTVACMPKPF